jgi:putative holliday junction resolvase
MREIHAAARFPFPKRFSFLSSPMTAEVVLGFDFGTRRIGIALGNSITHQARPLGVIDSEQTAVRWAAIARIVQEWQPARVIIGLPRHPDGAEHEMTRRAQRFGRQLAGRYGLPVVFVDERYSSVVLEAARDNDAEAAAVILQQWFNEQGRGAPEQHGESH